MSRVQAHRERGEDGMIDNGPAELEEFYDDKMHRKLKAKRWYR